jgi:hypothetical protein
MNAVIIIGLTLFGLALYYLLSGGPSPDLVFTASSEAEVIMMQKYLAAHGINTYIKNRDVQPFVLDGALGSPTLHVVDTKDYKKAIELIQSQESSRGLRHEHH